MQKYVRLMIVGVFSSLILVACGGDTVANVSVSTSNNDLAEEGISNDTQVDETQNEVVVRDYSEYNIITLLPRDGIPAIDNPIFLSSAEADNEYAPDELIIGVELDGDARAYSIGLLSSHEIVNDTVGGRKIAVTW